MGDPRKKRKQYEKPKKLWNAKRIGEESELREEFGLKNARELWRMQTILRKIRREARRLLSRKGKNVEERTQKLLNRVKSFLANNQELTLDDVLSLGVRDILSRRLQSIVFKKRFAKTMRQARQFITHGHVRVGSKRMSSPSYLVKFGEEDAVDWFKTPIPLEELKQQGGKKEVEDDAETEPETEHGTKHETEAGKTKEAENGEKETTASK